jgi:hypothetical protein
MRLVAHVGLVLALLISFSRAPQDHFHSADPDHTHSHSHSHHDPGHEADSGYKAVHGSGELELEAPDHDSTAQFKDWLAGDGSAAAKQSVEPLAATTSLPALTEQRRSLAVLSVRNHDPPTIAVHPARPPPLISSLSNTLVLSA